MDKVIHARSKKRKLLLRRIIVCLCLAAALFGVGEGVTAAYGGIRQEIPKLTGSSSVRGTEGVSLATGTVAGALSPGNTPSAGKAAGWFDDAVFVGDSRTQGLENYDGLGNASYYAVKGLMVNTAYTKAALVVNGKKETVMQALSAKKFGKVYIMLGINELGWSSMQKFVDDYAQLVADAHKDQPGAKIYLQSILPVSAKKSASDAVYNNKKIGQYNQAIEKIAREKGAVYLNVAEAVSDASGALPQAASTDGVHLNAAYCAKWCEYLKTHRG